MRDNKGNAVWLRDILESIDLIQHYLSDVTEEEFFDSQEKQDSVIRRLSIIGEAVKNLPDDFKEQHKDVAWEEAAGMRNILIHEYFDVDLDVAWNTLNKDLPNLKIQIKKLLS
jgi:uncharacterized protein with HEPN domain